MIYRVEFYENLMCFVKRIIVVFVFSRKFEDETFRDQKINASCENEIKKMRMDHFWEITKFVGIEPWVTE